MVCLLGAGLLGSAYVWGYDCGLVVTLFNACIGASPHSVASRLPVFSIVDFRMICTLYEWTQPDRMNAEIQHNRRFLACELWGDHTPALS